MAIRRFKGGGRRGFTLIELLVVITIIAILAGLLQPSFQHIQQQADNVQCQSNLRQLVAAAHAYAQDHDSIYPTIQPSITNPVQFPTGVVALGLVATLQPYGITNQTVQCRADLKTINSYAQQGTSYWYSPLADGENSNTPQVYTRRRVFTVSPTKLRLLYDNNPVHFNKANFAYADGHIVEH